MAMYKGADEGKDSEESLGDHGDDVGKDTKGCVGTASHRGGPTSGNQLGELRKTTDGSGGVSDVVEMDPLYTRDDNGCIVWHPARAYVVAPKHTQATVATNAATPDVLESVITEQRVQDTVDYNDIVIRDRLYRVPEWSVPGL